MDLGIRGRTAIVCASSQGLGKACALALAEAGVSLVINGRNHALLEQTAEDIRRATGVTVTPVAADVSTAEGQAALLAACPAPDILINNNGGPPFRDFRQLDRQALLTGVTMNMVTPIELIQKVIDAMATHEFGRIVNITSISVKMPLAGLDLSSGARRPHRLRGRNRPHRRRPQRHHQQSAAGEFQYPASARRLRRRLQENRQAGVGLGGAGHRRDSRPAFRHSGGVRTILRLPVQRPRLVHHRPEFAAGRRSLSGRLLGRALCTATACPACQSRCAGG